PLSLVSGCGEHFQSKGTTRPVNEIDPAIQGAARSRAARDDCDERTRGRADRFARRGSLRQKGLTAQIAGHKLPIDSTPTTIHCRVSWFPHSPHHSFRRPEAKSTHQPAWLLSGRLFCATAISSSRRKDGGASVVGPPVSRIVRVLARIVPCPGLAESLPT